MLRFSSLLFAGLMVFNASWGVELEDVSRVMHRPHPNLSQAENLSRQFIAQEPNTTKGRYFLAQILEKEGQYSEALTTLHEAQKLDPSLSFASSQARYYETESRLTSKAQANGFRPQVTAPAQQVQPVQMTSPTATPQNSTPPPKHNSGHGFLWIILGLGLWVGLLFWFISSRIAAKKEAEALAKRRNEQLAQLLEFTQKLDSIILSARADKKVKLQAVAEDTRKAVNEMLENIKASKTLASDSYLASIKYRIASFDTVLKTDADYSEPAVSTGQHEYEADTDEERNSGAYSGNSGTGRTYSTQPQQGNTTIINDYSNSASSGLVEGMMIGSMMHNSEPRVIVERETVYERPEREDSYSRTTNNDFDDRGSDNTPTFDSGGSDSGGGSFDFGGSDD